MSLRGRTLLRWRLRLRLLSLLKTVSPAVSEAEVVFDRSRSTHLRKQPVPQSVPEAIS